jgi:hypothetical protein
MRRSVCYRKALSLLYDKCVEISLLKVRSIPPPDEAAIDALYGLEPVIEPSQEPAGAPGAESTQFATVRCPYCGEPFDTLVDTSGVDASAGSTSYIEDCQVCCRPIEMHLEVGMNGELIALSPQRSD